MIAELEEVGDESAAKASVAFEEFVYGLGSGGPDDPPPDGFEVPGCVITFAIPLTDPLTAGGTFIVLTADQVDELIEKLSAWADAQHASHDSLSRERSAPTPP